MKLLLFGMSMISNGSIEMEVRRHKKASERERRGGGALKYLPKYAGEMPMQQVCNTNHPPPLPPNPAYMVGHML